MVAVPTKISSIPDAQALKRLASWLADASIAEGPVEDPRILAGGTQNLILRVTADGQNLVVRMLPPDVPGSVKTARREAVILSSLADTTVPHPRFRGLCEDEAVLGGIFLVTDEVRGFNATNEMPGTAGADPATRRAMGLALVDGLVALADVPPDTGSLATIGQPDGFLGRQVDRWASQLASYETCEGWPGASVLGRVSEIGDWLAANIPDDYRPGLMHGDYHIANVLYRADGGALAAILDWEMAAIGDPMLDLARLVTSWPNARNEGLLSLKVEPWDGFPSAEELVERYAAGTQRSMHALPWFEILACYKFGIILEGTYARACAGRADAGVAERLHRSAQGLIARATSAIERA